MLVIIKCFSKADGCKCKASYCSAVARTLWRLFQEDFQISIIIPHCLNLLNRYHYAFVPSTCIPAMKYKIIYVYFKKNLSAYLFEIMDIQINMNASSCGETLWKALNHRTNPNKILDQRNKASPSSLSFSCLILIYKNKTKKASV